MPIYTRFVVVPMLVLFASQSILAAPPTEPAALFPPGTLAYAEFVNPAELSPQLALIFQGTSLEDSIPFIHQRKDVAKTPFELHQEELALVGLLASPELLAEFKKLRIAAGITGFTDGGEIDGYLVVLTADSPATGLAARAWITMHSTVRKVAEVGGIPIFQHRKPTINQNNAGVPMLVGDKALSDGRHEATYAYLPGLFIVGTSKVAVGQAIDRFQGNQKHTLADTELFKQVATNHRQTGLFFFVNFPEFAAQFQKANSARGGLGRIEELIGADLDTDLYAWFKLTANPKAVQSLAGRMTFRDGGLVTKVVVGFDPTQTSPLFELLSRHGVKSDWLNHAHRPFSSCFALAFPDKDRGASVAAFLDALAKATGELGRLPGEAFAEFEKKYKISLSDELLGKTQGATIVFPRQQELPKGARVWPLVVLHCNDASIAEEWEKVFPRLIAHLAGEDGTPQPVSESIAGVKVFSLPGVGLPTRAPVHYARREAVFAIGVDRKLVAAAVKANLPNAISDGQESSQVPSDALAAFGTLTLRPLITALLEKPQVEGPVVPLDPKGHTSLFPGGQPVPEKWLEEAKKARADLLASLDTLPPITLQVRRLGNELRIEFYQPKLQNGGLRTLIDAAANWIDKTRYSSATNPFDPLGRKEINRR